jgi:tRNA(fMet)-specific endonuclease VapC
LAIVLDTSAYSQMRRGHGVVLDQLAEAAIVFVPVIVIGELRAGFELGDRTKDNIALLDAFLGEPFVETIEVTPAIAAGYGRAFAELRRAGTPIPINDIWIAACALRVGARLLTFDRDFLRVPGLDVELLEAPTSS